MQMLTNGGDTEGLFRAAFMSSGAPLSTGSVEDRTPALRAIRFVLIDTRLRASSLEFFRGNRGVWRLFGGQWRF